VTTAAPPPDQPIPALSLVLGTVGRTRELGVFLDALRGQEAGRLEVVLVDQNPDDRVPRLLAERGDPVAIRLVRAPRGLSRARNAGLRHARAAILGFPDDDCWYPPGLVARVLRWFGDHPDADGLSCRVTDERGRHSAGGFMSAGSHWITRSNVWRSAVSPGLFVRRAVHEAVGGFDERLGTGAGTPWGSGEETDYLLRAIRAGRRVWYDGDLVVHHPRPAEHAGRPGLGRSWAYGRGMGRVLRRHRYGLGSALYYASLSWGSAGVSCVRLAPGRALERAVMGMGRLAGWCETPAGTMSAGDEAPGLGMKPR
jgi:glycosyltransferase involved in cell wall biosynthesis